MTADLAIEYGKLRTRVIISLVSGIINRFYLSRIFRSIGQFRLPRIGDLDRKEGLDETQRNSCTQNDSQIGRVSCLLYPSLRAQTLQYIKSVNIFLVFLSLLWRLLSGCMKKQTSVSSNQQTCFVSYLRGNVSPVFSFSAVSMR